MYHAILVFAMVDIGPRLGIEIFTLTTVIIFSAMANALIYGQISLLTEVL